MPPQSRIAAIVLAAGRSTRMGVANKLLSDIEGAPMVRRVVQAALASHARPVLVVTGHQADEVRAALAGLDVAFVHNPDYAGGLSTSLKAGIATLPEAIEGAVVLLGDMPRVTADHIDRLIDAFATEQGRCICVPVHQGRRGNPVLWSSAFFPQMQQLGGDAGARTLLGAHPDRVREVDLATDAIFLDVDTPEALAKLRARGA